MTTLPPVPLEVLERFYTEELYDEMYDRLSWGRSIASSSRRMASKIEKSAGLTPQWSKEMAQRAAHEVLKRIYADARKMLDSWPDEEAKAREEI